jgi:hypothetical protein
VLRWTARGFAASEDDFGDDGADYQLCVYTDDGVTTALVDDPAAPAGGWKHGNGSMHFHGRKAGPHAGVASARLGAKKGGGALKVGVAGDDLSLPPLPFGSLVFACEAGGILGGASTNERLALADFGSALGLAFQEREIFDLYGVTFEGHPDLRRILMWDEFKDFPMRKDYRPPMDYEWEPTPHAETLERARQMRGIIPPTTRAEEKK